jgi:hypothetical protein
MAATKLHLDCGRVVALRAEAMEDNRDLVNKLLTHAGMVMEDAHPAAVIDEGALTIASRIAAVRQAGATILSLADAAERLWHSVSRAAENEPS